VRRTFIALGVVAAALAGPGSLRVAVAVDAKDVFRKLGDEAVVGQNATGEACRLRLVQERAEALNYQRYSLYCEGWSSPSGEIRKFATARDTSTDKLLTDSTVWKALSPRLQDCGPPENTTVLDGVAARLRECRRVLGGWRVLVLATQSDRVGYVVEGFPTNLPVLEAAVDFLRGRRPAERLAARGGSASAAIRRSEALLEAGGLASIRDVGARSELSALARRYDHAGNAPQAEATFRRLLELERRVLGPDHPEAAYTMSYLAHELGVQGRFEEADRLFARAEPLLHKATTPWAWGYHLTWRSGVERRRGNLPEAVRYGEDSIRFFERTPYKGGHAEALVQTARAYCLMQRDEDCERALQQGLSIVNGPGPEPDYRAWRVGEIHHDLGLLYVRQKKLAAARRELEAGLERRRQLYGDSVLAASSLRALARLALAEGAPDRALESWRRVTEIELRDARARDFARPESIAGYLETLTQLAEAEPTRRAALGTEAFAAVQVPRGGETAKAVARMAARMSTADPALQTLQREFEDAMRERDRARQALGVQAYREQADPEGEREASLRQRLQQAEMRVANLEQGLQAGFPRYRRLTADAPVPAADAAAMLRPGEAMLVVFPTREATWILLLRDGTVEMRRAPLTREALDTAVKTIRASLDLRDGTVRPFAAAPAHELWKTLLAPLDARLKGVDHLVVIAHGALQSLPLGLLPTAPVGERDDLRRAPWLAQRMASSVVPTVASLKQLRATAGRSRAAKPFLGFGDPDFAGAPGDTRAIARAVDVCRDGPLTDADVVRALPRLRETAAELRSIARSLGAGEDAVVVGAAATETAVKAAELRRYRVVAFATHGLLAAELKCKNEPALALTPPVRLGPADDGLLDASEVMQLSLDADWVVLSACNTAAPDGRPTGEALSGLARAFFDAGARSVLVSHWAVASVPTVKLTTGLFGAYAKDTTLGRAEALRRAQRTLWEQAETAHPAFWAPFVVGGDGG
jgi:CHAT domain-containing protein